jgi:probable HAF family extracellular repeat protein
MMDLGTLGGNEARAEDINDAGLIVGSSKRPDGAVHATLWTPP